MNIDDALSSPFLFPGVVAISVVIGCLARERSASAKLILCLAALLCPGCAAERPYLYAAGGAVIGAETTYLLTHRHHDGNRFSEPNCHVIGECHLNAVNP